MEHEETKIKKGRSKALYIAFASIDISIYTFVFRLFSSSGRYLLYTFCLFAKAYDGGMYERRIGENDNDKDDIRCIPRCIYTIYTGGI